MKIIFLGPPASGKGAQSKLLSDYFNLSIVSTGEIIRNLIKSDSGKSDLFREQLNSGNLITDSDLIELVKEYLLNNKISDNFIADGFPRTKNQADLLFDSNIFSQDVILLVLNVAPKVLYERMGIRCNLEHRTDDNLETFNNRLTVFNQNLIPLKSKFINIIEVDGNQSIEYVHNEIITKLKKAFHYLGSDVK